MTLNWFEMRWATVCYFRKTEHTKRLLFDPGVSYENYEYYVTLVLVKTPNDFALV